MARSPGLSSSASLLHDSSALAMQQQQHEADSDDSGVDVKPRMLVRDDSSPVSPDPLGGSSADSRRNKRKSSEPKKRKEVLLMKRFRWDTDEEEDAREDEDDVFDVLSRPSSGDSGCQPDTGVQKTGPRSWRRPPVKREEDEDCCSSSSTPPAFRQSVIRKNETAALLLQPHPAATTPGRGEDDDEEEEDDETSAKGPEKGGGRQASIRPRNYKGMSRQRRIEANARERTRVHTISAAFESLRRAVPAYAHNQKLSKLAVLRIASAYIVALACLNGGGAVSTRTGEEEEEEEDASSMSECVEQCTRTIQAEGRSRRRTSKE